jgi:integrase
MIHLKRTLDIRRKRKDGTYPVVFRITVNGKSRDISSCHSCSIADWDPEKANVKIKTEELLIKHERIKEQKLSILNKIKMYELKYHDKTLYDVQQVKDFICGKSHELNNVKLFWIKEINNMIKSARHGNARSLHFSLSSLELVRSLDVRFEVINYKWLNEVEVELLAKGLKYTSIGVYFRSLRSVFNKAINMGIIDQNHYPFKAYKIKTGVTVPRNLILDDVKKFFKYSPTNEKLAKAYDMGKLIFMLRGINFRDLALLKKEDLQNERVTYIRAKTHKLYNIKLEQEALEIIERYKSVDEELLLNILSSSEYDNKDNLHKILAQKLKVLNKWLRVIGKELGYTNTLSTYVFRYSYANTCRSLGYSKDIISQSLGHQNTNGAKVTDRYLCDYDNEIIDNMNRVVIKSVCDIKAV